MNAIQETRAALISLSVAMLGSAPGVDLLSEWTEAHGDGMSLADIANRIAASEAFRSGYPAFLTGAEFAESFIGKLLGGENVPSAVIAAATDIVTELLEGGMTRGEVALAAVNALLDIDARGESHPAHEDLGDVARSLVNRIEVATYYTVELRQTGPSSRVLRDIDSDVGLDDVRDGIVSLLVDPPEPFLLTTSRDQITGTAADELFIAEQVSSGMDTLNHFDFIDGGAGYDTLEIYQGKLGQNDGIVIAGDQADVRNVERVWLSASSAMDVDLTAWEGLELVELGRFGIDADISVKVDGATVRSARDFGGDVTIDGVGGALRLTMTNGVGRDEAHVVTRGWTTEVTVDANGDAVRIDGDGAGGHSMSLTDVTAIRFGGLTVYSDALESLDLSSSHGSVSVSSDAVEALTVNLAAFGGEHRWPGLERAEERVGALALTNSGEEGDDISNLTLNVSDASRFALHSAIVNLTVAGAADLELLFNAFVDNEGAWEFVGPDGVARAVDGRWVMLNAAGNVIVALDPEVEFDGTKYNLNETRQLEDYVAAYNEANDETEPDIHSVAEARPVPDGREDLEIDWTTTTLETITVSGAVDLTANLAGNPELLSIDAGNARGDMTLAGLGEKLTSYTGSAGNDRIEFSGLAAAAVTVDLGAGDDEIEFSGLPTVGVTVDLGAGDDRFADGGGNGASRIEAGSGTDTLLLPDPDLAAITYLDEEGNRQLIYSGFEILDISGGAGVYDLAALGFDNVESRRASSGDITLTNAPVDLDLRVSGRGGGATRLILELKELGPGSGLNRTEAGIFTLALLGTSNLQFTPDREIEAMIIDSRTTFSSFNRISIHDGADEFGSPTLGDSLEKIQIIGRARLVLEAAAGADGDQALTGLEYVDARQNSGGATVNLAGSGLELLLLGGTGADRFTGGGQADELVGNNGRDHLDGGAGDDTLAGGAGDDTLAGGAGEDILIGGAGADTQTGGSGANAFVYTSVADSQLQFTSTGIPIRMDTVTDWDTGAGNRILLPASLFGRLHGFIKDADNANPDAIWEVRPDETDENPDTLKDFIDEYAEGFFETGGVPRGGGLFGNTPIELHPAAFLREFDSANDVRTTWVFIDVDVDGDFDASTDMVIALTGDANIGPDDFAAADI